MNREHIKTQLPSITDFQLDILDFWAVRGWNDISHCLGYSIDLKKQPEFRTLGLELIYLEQFYKEAFNEGAKFALHESKGVKNVKEKIEMWNIINNNYPGVSYPSMNINCHKNMPSISRKEMADKFFNMELHKSSNLTKQDKERAMFEYGLRQGERYRKYVNQPRYDADDLMKQFAKCVEEASQKKSITKPLNRLTPKEE